MLPSYITLRHELNEAEQRNILEATKWASVRKRDVLAPGFLDNLHKRMFNNVWRWAGIHRRSGKTIGIDAYRIPQELAQLMDDCRDWIQNRSFEPDEIAVRFHHKLVWIHPYSNGNGHHARIATDLLLHMMGRPEFTWGSENLADSGTVRKAYIEALRSADRHDYKPLLEFVRT